MTKLNKRSINRGKAKVTVGAEVRNGNLGIIARTTHVEAPSPPACLSLGCLLDYFKDSLLCALLSSYHARRVAYSMEHYYTVDAVSNAWRIRRAGINPETNFKYEHIDKTYLTYEDAVEATRKIYNKVLSRYRTGEPAPETLWQAIHANLKLKCPVCRKYNVDPFLFGGKND